jgi:hypothetical protein
MVNVLRTSDWTYHILFPNDWGAYEGLGEYLTAEPRQQLHCCAINTTSYREANIASRRDPTERGRAASEADEGTRQGCQGQGEAVEGAGRHEC